MLNRRLLRTVAALLLVWIAADLAVLDACRPDAGRQPSAAQATLSAAAHHGGAAHPRGLTHADYCFCHGLSTGADCAAAVTDPRTVSQAVPVAPPGRVLLLSFTLDHPPQLTA